MAVQIAVSAKVGRRRPCATPRNACWSTRTSPARSCRGIANAFREKKVEMRADAVFAGPSAGRQARRSPPTGATEFLDYIIAIKQVDSIDEAIEHITKYGSQHTDAIVTETCMPPRKFIAEVDSASVMVNASTRFADGGEYGLGAEIGISTDKLHARGPMGAADLCTYKYVVTGTGHIRL